MTFSGESRPSRESAKAPGPGGSIQPRQSPSESEGLFLSENAANIGARLELPPGVVLNRRFRIREPLGRGASCRVFLAEDAVRGDRVALKIIPLNPAGEDVAAELIKNEMRIYGCIENYRNVLRLHDIYLTTHGHREHLLFSLEYADGGSFRDWLRAHRGDLQKRRTEGLFHFRQMCEGVKAFHDVGAVHLDLKPENLLFLGELLKVADLGAAQFFLDHPLRAGDWWETTFTCGGTAAYMSPEHFTASFPDDLGPAADMYSLGIILYEFLHPNCHPPFHGDYARLRELHADVEAPPLPQAEPRLAGIVARCLMKNPLERYQSIPELLDALDGPEPAAVDVNLQPELEDNGELPEEFQELHDRACERAQAKDYHEAKRLCQDILKRFPDHSDSQRLLEDIRTRDEQAVAYYRRVEYELERTDLSELVALIDEAAAIYPNHPAGRVIQSTVLSRTRKYQTIMAQACGFLRRENWEFALSCLEQARALCPNSVGVSRAAETLSQAIFEVDNERKRIKELALAGKRRQAFALADALDDYIAEINDRFAAVEDF